MRKTETLVKELFGKGIVKINPEEPFTWASGIKSPIYTNFRQVMNYPDIRILILDMLSNKIIEKIQNGLKFDAVIGTSTAGIWIGKLISERFEKPFVILKDGNAFEEHRRSDILTKIMLTQTHSNVDLIISGCPFGISSAISLAFLKNWSMGYIRQKPKVHGDPLKIEGNPNADSNAFIIDLYEDRSQLGQIEEILSEAKINVSGSWTEHIIPTRYNLNGKKVLIIEDLISTGGSLFKEAEIAMNLGAIVACTASIFTYNFEESTQNALKLDIDQMVSALNIRDIMQVGIDEKFIKKENELLLKNFFVNPYNWYEIYHPDKQLNGC